MNRSRAQEEEEEEEEEEERAKRTGRRRKAEDVEKEFGFLRSPRWQGVHRTTIGTSGLHINP